MPWILRVSVAAVAAAVLSCGHVTNNTKPWVAGDPTAAVSFCGIKHSLNTGKPVRILFIHGMGQHDFDYPEALQKTVVQQLGAQPLGCTGPYHISRDDDRANDYGGLLRCTFRRIDGATLRTYILVWSPLTRPYKIGAMQYDIEDPYKHQRAVINKTLKEGLIDGAFSDAVLYAGQLQQAMRYSVRQAICASITDQIDLSQPCHTEIAPDVETGDLFVVTHSLGSVMLFETLLEASRDASTDVASKELFRRVRLIVMLANQLPLLNLSRITKPPADASLVTPPENPFARLFATRGARPIPVVAVSDVNDLLSYTVPENWQSTLFPGGRDVFTFMNVETINADRAYLGAFANAGKAHVGYWENPGVINMIIDGYDCRF